MRWCESSWRSSRLTPKTFFSYLSFSKRDLQRSELSTTKDFSNFPFNEYFRLHNNSIIAIDMKWRRWKTFHGNYPKSYTKHKFIPPVFASTFFFRFVCALSSSSFITLDTHCANSFAWLANKKLLQLNRIKYLFFLFVHKIVGGQSRADVDVKSSRWILIRAFSKTFTNPCWKFLFSTKHFQPKRWRRFKSFCVTQKTLMKYLNRKIIYPSISASNQFQYFPKISLDTLR